MGARGEFYRALLDAALNDDGALWWAADLERDEAAGTGRIPEWGLIDTDTIRGGWEILVAWTERDDANARDYGVWISDPFNSRIQQLDESLDVSQVDPALADIVVQYALYGSLVHVEGVA